MMVRHFGYELALLVILCILGIFLFPAASGPYAAVHGPVTALRAVRAAARLRWAMALAALGMAGLGFWLSYALAFLKGELGFPAAGSPGSRALLRC